jgi:uncharacterized membrane protein YkvA (DUF1232 family)
MGEKGEHYMNFLGDNKCLSGPVKCFLLLAALIYIISPIDLIPEAIFGPLGLIDDLAVGLAAWQLIKGGDILSGLSQAKKIKHKK